jgi:hypothetical protein
MELPRLVVTVNSPRGGEEEWDGQAVQATLGLGPRWVRATTV